MDKKKVAYWGWGYGEKADPADELEKATKRYCEKWNLEPDKVLVRTGLELPVTAVDVEYVDWLAANTFYFPVDQEKPG